MFNKTYQSISQRFSLVPNDTFTWYYSIVVVKFYAILKALCFMHYATDALHGISCIASYLLVHCVLLKFLLTAFCAFLSHIFPHLVTCYDRLNGPTSNS